MNVILSINNSDNTINWSSQTDIKRHGQKYPIGNFQCKQHEHSQMVKLKK